MYPSVRKCPEEMNHFKPDGPSGIQDCFTTSGVAGTQQTSGVKNITTHSLPEELVASIPVHNGEDTSSEGLQVCFENTHTLSGLWNYQILLLVDGQISGQNPIIQPRFACPKIGIFLIS